MDASYGALGALSRLSYTSMAIASLLLWLTYLASLAIYRLYLSPLAHFPGPKLAALTKFYEMYYEVAKRGQFIFKIEEMHEKYGEIVLASLCP